MQVRPERPSGPAAFEARRAVVPVPGDHASERHGTRVQHRPTRVVLEARDRPSRRLVQRAFEEHVADHATLTRERLVREERCALEPRAVPPAVAATEELVAAADGEQRRSPVDRLAQRGTVTGEVGRDHRLLTVLTAPDVEEVVTAGHECSSDRDRFDAELVPARRGTALEDGDVAPVGIDVEVLGVEMTDADDHRVSVSQ